jgi:AcrR family transcriptional regulator
VSRRRAPDRLNKILDAALRVFARTGLERSKMSDVAAEAGVSQGTLYNYVESKEALFHLLLDRGLGGDLPAPTKLPVRGPSPDVLAARMEEAIGAGFALPKLDEALRRRQVRDPSAELSAIIDELFERTEATREAADALERSALDVPELAAVFYGNVRRGLFDRFSRLIEIRAASGHYRSTQPRVIARMLVETVTMFARHIYNDREPAGFDPAIARRAVRETLVAGLLRPGAAVTPSDERGGAVATRTTGKRRGGRRSTQT